MNMPVKRILATLSGSAVLLGLAFGLGAGSPESAPAKKDAPPPDRAGKVTVAEARERAKLMHNIYAATLDSMHHHFFRRERAVLPARAMEDVFEEMDRLSKIKAAWISVNTRAMSIHHEPKNDFEKQAARAIAAGKGEYEQVKDGYYHRAGAIPLGGGCVSCHAGLFAKTPKHGHFAGLVISIPINEE